MRAYNASFERVLLIVIDLWLIDSQLNIEIRFDKRDSPRIDVKCDHSIRWTHRCTYSNLNDLQVLRLYITQSPLKHTFLSSVSIDSGTNDNLGKSVTEQKDWRNQLVPQLPSSRLTLRKNMSNWLFCAVCTVQIPNCEAQFSHRTTCKVYDLSLTIVNFMREDPTQTSDSVSVRKMIAGRNWTHHPSDKCSSQCLRNRTADSPNHWTLRVWLQEQCSLPISSFLSIVSVLPIWCNSICWDHFGTIRSPTVM